MFDLAAYVQITFNQGQAAYQNASRQISNMQALERYIHVIGEAVGACRKAVNVAFERANKITSGEVAVLPFVDQLIAIEKMGGANPPVPQYTLVRGNLLKMAERMLDETLSFVDGTLAKSPNPAERERWTKQKAEIENLKEKFEPRSTGFLSSLLEVGPKPIALLDAEGVKQYVVKAYQVRKELTGMT
jgi:hypothetical protein